MSARQLPLERDQVEEVMAIVLAKCPRAGLYRRSTPRCLQFTVCWWIDERKCEIQRDAADGIESLVDAVMKEERRVFA